MQNSKVFRQNRSVGQPMFFEVFREKNNEGLTDSCQISDPLTTRKSVPHFRNKWLSPTFSAG